VAGGDAPHGIVRRAVTARVRSDWLRCRLDGDHLLADGAAWAAMDYATVDSRDVEGRVSFTIGRDGVADGIVLWFDGDFGAGVTLSNSPRAPRAMYGQAFFPFERSLQLRAGDTLAVDLRAHLLEGDYVWGWDTRLTRAAAGAPPVAFRQSNLATRIESLEALRADSDAHQPRQGSLEAGDESEFPRTRSTG